MGREISYNIGERIPLVCSCGHVQTEEEAETSASCSCGGKWLEADDPVYQQDL